MDRLIQDLIKDAACKAGVDIDSIEDGNRHIIVKVSRGSKQGVVVVGRSPSDYRFLRNTVKHMKRVTS